MAALVMLSAAAAGQTAVVTVVPAESQELFANPAMGWQTFHANAMGDPDYGTLPSSVMYVRYYWVEFEPKPGEYDWTILDKAIEDATAAGQTVAFRVMTAGTGRPQDWSPAWLKDMGARTREYRTGGAQQWTPDFNDSVFLEKHEAFIEAMGKRYNGRPEVALVDIGSIGLWGEWHMSQTDVPMPTEENAIRIVEAYKRAFPDTPLAMQLDHIAGMKHAVTRGIGWRVDCWGDMGGFSKTWCHMRAVYPQALRETGSKDAWKRAPVALETCWDMRRWEREKWDLDYILKWALDCHASFINNKSQPVPEAYMPKVKAFLKRVGYRYVVRSATYPGTAAPESSFTVELLWDNVGVAPCYRDYHPAIALADGEGRVVWSQTFAKFSTRDWLPGRMPTTLTASLPKSVAPGEYTLLAGVAGDDGRPAVRLAIEGRREDGWHSLGRMAVTRPE
jgi:hypothetical protein